MFDPVNGAEVTGLDTDIRVSYCSSLCLRERVKVVGNTANKRSSTSVGRHARSFAQIERQARVKRSEIPK